MKLAVLSDVHGNLPALTAVVEDLLAWQPDRVVLNGDLVNRGPLSLAVLQFIQQALPQCDKIRGNHENYLLACHRQTLDPARIIPEIDAMAFWSTAQLGNAITPLADWADNLDIIDRDGGVIHVTHASRIGDRSGIQPETEGEMLRERMGQSSRLMIVSHTHRAFIRQVESTTLANIGSVGQPFDGDPRASYGRFSFSAGVWHSEIRRVAFDRQQSVRDFHDSGFVSQIGPLGPLILREFNDCTMHVGPWRRLWLEAIRRGEITVAASVTRYMAQIGA
jgi:predicted phosphodiesterase